MNKENSPNTKRRKYETIQIETKACEPQRSSKNFTNQPYHLKQSEQGLPHQRKSAHDLYSLKIASTPLQSKQFLTQPKLRQQVDYGTVSLSGQYQPYFNYITEFHHPHYPSSPSEANPSTHSPVQSVSLEQNNLMNSTTVPTLNPGLITINEQHQLTPSPSPRQCETSIHLSEHHAADNLDMNSTKSPICSFGTDDAENEILPLDYSNYRGGVQLEKENNFVNLDSKNIIHPPCVANHQGRLPPFHSLRPMYRLLFRPESLELYDFLSISQPTPPPTVSPTPPPTASPTPVPSPTTSTTSSTPSITSPTPSTTTSTTSPTPSTTSPTPSTTGSTTTTVSTESFSELTPTGSTTPTPSPTSTPTPTPPSRAQQSFYVKRRRPKIYQCSSCVDRWFTSLATLKRHYESALHRIKLQSSGILDPELMPISSHHQQSRNINDTISVEGRI